MLFYVLKSQTRDLKSCQLIASDKSNLLRKVDFLLESRFQVIAFFISLEVGYLYFRDIQNNV